jgi:hypothetical protein
MCMRCLPKYTRKFLKKVGAILKLRSLNDTIHIRGLLHLRPHPKPCIWGMASPWGPYLTLFALKAGVDFHNSGLQQFFKFLHQEGLYYYYYV